MEKTLQATLNCKKTDIDKIINFLIEIKKELEIGIIEIITTLGMRVNPI